MTPQQDKRLLALQTEFVAGLVELHQAANDMVQHKHAFGEYPQGSMNRFTTIRHNLIRIQVRSLRLRADIIESSLTTDAPFDLTNIPDFLPEEL